MYEKINKIVVKYQQLEKKIHEEYRAEMEKAQAECVHEPHWAQIIDDTDDTSDELKYLIKYCHLCGKIIVKIDVPKTIQDEISRTVDDAVECILSRKEISVEGI